MTYLSQEGRGSIRFTLTVRVGSVRAVRFGSAAFLRSDVEIGRSICDIPILNVYCCVVGESNFTRLRTLDAFPPFRFVQTRAVHSA